MSGAEERVEAEVVRTRLWRHRPQGEKPHTHSAATLLIEGLNEVRLPQADGLERGTRVDVWIRRGRISQWPYFVELASARTTDEATPAAPEAEASAEPPAEEPPPAVSPGKESPPAPFEPSSLRSPDPRHRIKRARSNPGSGAARMSGHRIRRGGFTSG